MEGLPILGIDRHRMLTDGRGITTLVALSGCPLSCRYCINQELLKDTNKIEWLSPSELVERLAIDHCYFVYTHGGVTFGGGEPLLHSRQIREFSRMCPEEWNITIETSLNVDSNLLKPLLTDRFSFLVDIKAMQPDIYRRYTGQNNVQVKENLKRLIQEIPTEQYMVKIPVIPEYSGADEVKESMELLQEMGILEENIVDFTYMRSMDMN